MQAAKNFAAHENNIEMTMQNIRKMELITQHMGYQCEAMEENAPKLEYVKEQVNAMER